MGAIHLSLFGKAIVDRSNSVAVAYGKALHLWIKVRCEALEVLQLGSDIDPVIRVQQYTRPPTRSSKQDVATCQSGRLIHPRLRPIPHYTGSVPPT